MGVQSSALFGILALACALIGGYFFGTFLLSLRREAAYKKSIAGRVEALCAQGAKLSANAEDKGVNARVVAYMKSAKARKPRFRIAKRAPRSNEVEKLVRLAGLEGQVTPQAFYETRARMLLIGAILGAIAGTVFSLELACILALVGALIGAQLPKHALKSRISRRTCEAERHLPEMLDVLALCMRSGLSIDASIAI